MELFSKFLNMKLDDSPSALGIDIGSSAIKIVQIKKKNSQAVLETYGELALGPYAGLPVGASAVLPPDKIAQALMDLMREKERLEPRYAELVYYGYWYSPERLALQTLVEESQKNVRGTVRVSSLSG